MTERECHLSPTRIKEELGTCIKVELGTCIKEELRDELKTHSDNITIVELQRERE